MQRYGDNNRRFGGGGHRGGRGRGRGFGGRGRGGGRGGGSGRGSFWFKGEGYNDQGVVSIEEDVVGIRGYLDDPEIHQGFDGVIKQRYEDFVVHEVAKQGGKVQLTQLIERKLSLKAKVRKLLLDYLVPQSEREAMLQKEQRDLRDYNDPMRPKNHQELHDAGDAGQDQDDANNNVIFNPETKQVCDSMRCLLAKLNEMHQQLALQSEAAIEKLNLDKLIKLVTEELGKRKGKEFEAYLAQVRERRDQDLAREAEAAAAGISHPPHEEQDALVFYIGGLNDKEDRVAIHQAMRQYGKSFIVADTITADNGSQVIRIRSAFVGASKRKATRNDWPVDRPEYLQFVLFRKNKGINATINQISSMIRAPISSFSYSEPKERRAIVTQLCTAHRLPEERMAPVQRMLLRNAAEQSFAIGHLRYVPHPATLQYICGNHIQVVIRKISWKANKNSLLERVDRWKERGFINFFGLDHFGQSATPLFELGRAILRQDYRAAISLLLRPQEGEASKIREAREHFRQHKDVEAALRMFPPPLVAERAALEGLMKHGIEGHDAAYRNIPLDVRVGYVKAYQFYVWNQMASLRMEKYSHDKPIVGDLVYEQNKHAKAQDVAPPAAKKRRIGPEELVTKPAKAQVIQLTEENVDQYSIYDVLLPLPGYDIKFPKQEMGEAYKRVLMKDGVNFALWRPDAGPTASDYDLAGTYRKLLSQPREVIARIETFEQGKPSLIPNDLELLLAKQAARLPVDNEHETSQTMDATAKSNDATTTEPTSTSSTTPSSTPAKDRGLFLEFELDALTDASVALRELMKQSSSRHVQMAVATKNGGTSTATTSTAAKTTIITQSKKTTVAIGRPGFSLGKR